MLHRRLPIPLWVVLLAYIGIVLLAVYVTGRPGDGGLQTPNARQRCVVTDVEIAPGAWLRGVTVCD